MHFVLRGEEPEVVLVVVGLGFAPVPSTAHRAQNNRQFAQHVVVGDVEVETDFLGEEVVKERVVLADQTEK